MLQINYIRENREEAIKKLAKKGFDAKAIFEDIVAKDDLRKETQNQLDKILAQSNQIAKEIGAYFKNGEKEKAEEAKVKTVTLKQQSKTLSEKLSQVNDDLQELLIHIPNVPHNSVPNGKISQDNVIVKEEGDIPKLHSEALPHWELVAKYGLIDFELGTKISGA